MRYLKKFNEGSLTSTLTTEMVGELRDFCRDHLAYLIDEDFTVQVIPTFYGTECDVFIFKEVKERFTDIVTTEWSSIKDQIIPFLYMLNKHYTIVDAEDDVYNRSVQRYVNIQPSMVDNFINDDIHDFKAKKLRIKVDFKDKSITEAISQEDIKDFCEQYLAYLLDDGYALDFRESGRVTQIDLVKPKESPLHGRWSPGHGGAVDWMDWDHIKDHFIPFLKMLDREYDVKDNLITFQCPRAIQIQIPFQDVIDDKVKDILHDKLTLDARDRISSVRINVIDHSVQDYPWQVKEAKEDWRRNFSDDELQEVCDTFLPYLYDEGFVVHTTVPTYFMFKKNIITLWKEQEKGDGRGLETLPFYWHEIKDRFLPLFDYLNKNYPLGKVRLVHYYNSWERKENKKEVIFKSDNDKESWSGLPFSKFEEIMSRDAAYGRPMKIGEIIIEVQNLDEL
jgi:hypothetical protein